MNHLAPFLLTTLLLDRIRASAPARIITTARAPTAARTIPFDDVNAERGYRRADSAATGETKLANILFTTELARRLEGSGVTANCFHPGFVASGFNRNNGALMAFGMTRRPALRAQPGEGRRHAGLARRLGGGLLRERRVLRQPRSARRRAPRPGTWPPPAGCGSSARSRPSDGGNRPLTIRR